MRIVRFYQCQCVENRSCPAMYWRQKSSLVLHMTIYATPVKGMCAFCSSTQAEVCYVLEPLSSSSMSAALFALVASEDLTNRECSPTLKWQKL